jgi:DNA polymerase-3 subunit delta'|tara:strand:- start:49 stop:999 length:951 start_codon:yes stop_codon:yes gene_type:complete
MIDHYPWLKQTYHQLAESMKEHKNAHALLIQGDAGIGRYSLAKMLSDIFLDTEESKISNGIKDEIIISPIEGKKTISIDQVRSLKESLLLTSLKGKGKVGIIYPAEAMTYPAANSLLKILEEPPKDTLIMLITESSGKLPKTVISRSQIIDCGHPTYQDSLEWLDNKESGNWEPMLSVFGNRPILLSHFGHDYLTNLLDMLSGQITGLIEGQIKPSEISDSWKAEDIELNLRVLYSWLFKYMQSRLLNQENSENLPVGLFRMLNEKINNERCFMLMDEIVNLRELKTSGRGLNWNLHITELLNPFFINMSGLKDHA